MRETAYHSRDHPIGHTHTHINIQHFVGIKFATYSMIFVIAQCRKNKSRIHVCKTYIYINNELSSLRTTPERDECAQYNFRLERKSSHQEIHRKTKTHKKCNFLLIVQCAQDANACKWMANFVCIEILEIMLQQICVALQPNDQS